ncbi:MAG: PUR family DNA/RNA-binding protein [Bacteroidales bacterium]|jgi:hypothetical protein|nr:PUR family DNA/RNA-binding protein [Bacteroidales bacterium]
MKLNAENGTDYRVYSNLLRAGQRTYFFDVKINRNDQHYLVITESKKRLDTEGNPVFDKFKIHLYPETVEAFADMVDEMKKYVLDNTARHHHDAADDFTAI